MIDRFAHERHPAYQLDPAALDGPRLDGPHKQGIAAAHVQAGLGRDGRWYRRWGYSLADRGSWTPITHSPPFDSKDAAIADGLALIRAAISGNDCAWARRIEKWVQDRQAPQQLGLF